MLERTASKKMIPDDNICFTAESHVRKLFEPLQKSLGIDFFEYAVTYHDGRQITLTTNPTYYEAWFKHELPLCEFSLDTNWYTFDACCSPSMRKLASENGIGKGIVHISQEKNCSIFVAFASELGDKKDEFFYFNHLSLFKRFKYYFVENVNALLAKSNTQSMILPATMRAKSTFPALNTSSIIDYQDPLLATLFAPLNTLSPRELECFSLWLQGYGIHETCQILDLARTTVGAYRDRIKVKLGCHTRQELMAKARELGLIDFALI